MVHQRSDRFKFFNRYLIDLNLFFKSLHAFYVLLFKYFYSWLLSIVFILPKSCQRFGHSRRTVDRFSSLLIAFTLFFPKMFIEHSLVYRFCIFFSSYSHKLCIHRFLCQWEIFQMCCSSFLSVASTSLAAMVFNYRTYLPISCSTSFFFFWSRTI